MTKANRLAMIVSHGTLDVAMMPFVLAPAALAMDMEVGIFFTFYGLEILKKGRADKLQVSPIANPAMPQPIPGISVPNIIGVLPGMTAVATAMMNSWMKKAKVTKLSELLEMTKEMGVRMIGCQMTMDIMGIKREELIDGIEIGGAATFLEYASDNAITLAF
jgi:peroxiredoxin family protein